MAKIVHLTSKLPDIVNQVYERSREADAFREIEYNAAVKIQSWYRGLKIRAYIKNLNKNAMVIQRNWRGYMGRKNFRYILQEKVKLMRLDYYNQQAVLIQKIWRGYYSRKYIFNYYQRKAYLIAVQQKNEVILNELREYKDYMDKQREEKKNIEKYKRLEDAAKRNHYLISTKQIPGVYNSPYKPNPTEMEYLMRNVKLDPAEKHDDYVKSLKANRFESIQLPSSLPPLTVKPQGPFKDPLDVRKQRYRPFSPSLRVETDYESLEKGRRAMKDNERVDRLHDEIFYPIDKTIYKKPYEPLMLTRDKYKLLDYGRKHFRDEAKQNDWVSEQKFKTIVPQIHEFDKLNKTYVEPHFYLS